MRLHVTIDRCTELSEILDDLEVCSYYCLIEVEHQQVRTSSVKVNTNAEQEKSAIWNQNVNFDLTSQTSQVFLTVWAQGNVSETVQKIGGNYYEISGLTMDRPTPVLLPVSGKSEVHLEFRLYQHQSKKITEADFHRLKTIGKGSFGTVYLVRKIDTRNLYAMKVLIKHNVREKNAIKHTLNERAILKRVDHPFIVNLKFAFQTKDHLFMVMPYMNGGELFFHLSEGDDVFGEERAKFYAAEITLAIAYLHENGVLYRDLKPENILLDMEGHISIVDFGLSKTNVFDGDRTETFCGSLEYMPPELLAGVSYTNVVDWWALATMVYEMIYGLPPFWDEEQPVMLEKICGCAIDELQFDTALFSPECIDFIKSILQPVPENRLGFGVGGSKKIKKHPWFADVDWTKLYYKQVTPPFRPHVLSEFDMRYFDKEVLALDPSKLDFAKPKHKRLMEIDDNFDNFSFEEVNAEANDENLTPIKRRMSKTEQDKANRRHRRRSLGSHQLAALMDEEGREGLEKGGESPSKLSVSMPALMLANVASEREKTGDRDRGESGSKSERMTSPTGKGDASSNTNSSSNTKSQDKEKKPRRNSFTKTFFVSVTGNKDKDKNKQHQQQLGDARDASTGASDVTSANPANLPNPNPNVNPHATPVRRVSEGSVDGDSIGNAAATPDRDRELRESGEIAAAGGQQPQQPGSARARALSRDRRGASVSPVRDQRSSSPVPADKESGVPTPNPQPLKQPLSPKQSQALLHSPTNSPRHQPSPTTEQASSTPEQSARGERENRRNSSHPDRDKDRHHHHDKHHHGDRHHDKHHEVAKEPGTSVASPRDESEKRGDSRDRGAQRGDSKEREGHSHVVTSPKERESSGGPSSSKSERRRSQPHQHSRQLSGGELSHKRSTMETLPVAHGSLESGSTPNTPLKYSISDNTIQGSTKLSSSAHLPRDTKSRPGQSDPTSHVPDDASGGLAINPEAVSSPVKLGAGNQSGAVRVSRSSSDGNIRARINTKELFGVDKETGAPLSSRDGTPPTSTKHHAFLVRGRKLSFNSHESKAIGSSSGGGSGDSVAGNDEFYDKKKAKGSFGSLKKKVLGSDSSTPPESKEVKERKKENRLSFRKSQGVDFGLRREKDAKREREKLNNVNSKETDDDEPEMKKVNSQKTTFSNDLEIHSPSSTSDLKKSQK